MDSLIKILLVILGFLLGVSGQLIVKLYMERRKKAAIRDLIRTEMQAFIEACENAAKRKFWDSSSVEYISRHIIESYSSDRDRFMAISKYSTRQELFRFYLQVNSTLSLIESHRKIAEIDEDGSSAAIGPGTYEGIVDRTRAILETIK
ncbi:MAG: hypothetical protein ISS63_12835 [Desulfobacteraceae bacterium]|nr:hypothetical protein [Desulfobacteraceae bacterium]